MELPDDAIDRLLASLRRTVSVHDGRTYAGGLTKFEPREMERLPVPDPLAGGRLTVGAAFVAPPRWSADALDRDIAAAIEAFRLERFEEPLEQYHAHLDECLGTIEELIELTVNLSELRQRTAEVAAEARYLEALRFLAGPFISVDDLRVIAQTSLAPTALRADPEAAARVVETVLAGLDRRRFPWVGEGREPHEDEKSAAALATATLMATERVRTMRRNEARLVQESAVADALRGRRVPRGRRRRASSAPSRRPPGPASSAPSAPSATARPTWWSASGIAAACRSSARPRTRPPTPTSA